MSRGYWRKRAAPIIHAVLEQHGKMDEQTIQWALRDAYPFGERRGWPYKVWLDEIKRQRGKKPPLGERGPIGRDESPDQLDMFGAS